MKNKYCLILTPKVGVEEQSDKKEWRKGEKDEKTWLAWAGNRTRSARVPVQDSYQHATGLALASPTFP